MNQLPLSVRGMATGIWSDTEPSIEIATVDDLDRFVDFAESKAEMPTAFPWTFTVIGLIYWSVTIVALFT
jgi:hypothetical protein